MAKIYICKDCQKKGTWSENHNECEINNIKTRKNLKQNLTTGNLYPIMDSRPHQQGRHAWESVK